MRRLSYNMVCGTVVSCLVGGYIASFFFIRRLRPKEFKREFAAINFLYEKGDYRGAVAAYESLAGRSNIQCMSLYYNLANAHYRTGNLGRAILYYRKAEKLAPRDREVAANLRIAQAKAGLAVPPRRSASRLNLGRRLIKLFSLFEGVAASLTFRWLLLIFVVLTIFFGRKRRWFIRGCVVLAVLFYVSLAATIYKAYTQKSFKQAVVLVGQPLRTGPVDDGPTTRVLQEGTTVRLDSNQNGWCKIVLEDGSVGWIRERGIGEI
jgi:tetratricopeptide (TPR) repeat protein